MTEGRGGFIEQPPRQTSSATPPYQGGELIETRLRHLVAYNNDPHKFTSAEVDVLIAAINTLKALDPACGSGAFPMGMLHKLVYILGKLDPDNSKWRELQKQKAIKETEEAYKIGDREEREKRLLDISEVFENNASDYGRKLYLIENCIFGVDIQPIAVQIAKLRFFVSLIVDQRIDPKKENLGVRPLPNLETKFVAANTLIGIEKPKQERIVLNLAEIEKKEKELSKVRERYFTARTPQTKEKCRKDDELLRKEIASLFEEDGFSPESALKLAAWNPYDQNASADFFDAEWMFGIKSPSPLAGEGMGEGGFDVVIANPPYGADIDRALSVLRPIYAEVIQNYAEIYKMFFQAGIGMLNNAGTLTFITPNTYLSQPRYKDLRKFILRFKIDKIMNLGEGVFEECVVPVCLTFLQKKSSGNSYFLADVNEKSKFTGNLVDSRFLEIPLARVHSFKDLSLYFTSELGNDQVYFDSALEIKDAGIQYHRSGIGLKNKGGNDLYERLFSDSCEAFQNSRPVWYGKLINRYYMAENTDEYFNLYYHNVLRDKESVSFTVAAFEVTPRIIWRQTAACLQATVDEKRRWFRNTIQCAYLKPAYAERLNIKYVLAICNSKYIAFVYNRLVKESGRVFPQVKITHVKKLPLVIAAADTQTKIVTYVDQILTAKKKDPNADISALEKKIDDMVYALYGLTPEEIAIVEGKI